MQIYIHIYIYIYIYIYNEKRENLNKRGSEALDFAMAELI